MGEIDTRWSTGARFDAGCRTRRGMRWVGRGAPDAGVIDRGVRVRERQLGTAERAGAGRPDRPGGTAGRRIEPAAVAAALAIHLYHKEVPARRCADSHGRTVPDEDR